MEKIDLGENTDPEIISRLEIHQLYFGFVIWHDNTNPIRPTNEDRPHFPRYRLAPKSIEPIWSFAPVIGGGLLHVQGPICEYEDRLVVRDGPRTMVKTRTFFRCKGSNRWFPPERMAEFAFCKRNGFRWVHEPEVPTDPWAIVASGYGHALALGAIAVAAPYDPPRMPRDAAKAAFARLKLLWEGYGFAAGGHHQEELRHPPEPKKTKAGA